MSNQAPRSHFAEDRDEYGYRNRGLVNAELADLEEGKLPPTEAEKAAYAQWSIEDSKRNNKRGRVGYKARKLLDAIAGGGTVRR